MEHRQKSISEVWLSNPFHKCLLGLRSGLFVDHSRFSLQPLENFVFVELTLCTWSLSGWGWFGLSSSSEVKL